MTQSLKIVEADIGLLQPNPWNTNIVSPENENKIETSIRRFGFFRPVVVRTLEDGSLEIIGGEHRWSVAKRMGYKTVPVVNLGEIDEKKAKEISLVDNGRYGEDDALMLGEILKELGSANELMSFLPYSDTELDSLFDASNISLDDLDVPENDEPLPDLSQAAKQVQTHQIMRFKVPIEDADYVQRLIESTMKAQGYTEDDALTNAGHALVHILRGK